MATRRASIGAMELNIDKAKWQFQLTCMEKAEQELEKGNFTEAEKLCEAALEHDNKFYPGLEMKRRISKLKQVEIVNAAAQIPDLVNLADSTSSSDGSGSESDTPLRSRRVTLPPDTPKPNKSILKNKIGESSKSVDSSGCSSKTRREHHVHSGVCKERKQNQTQLQKILVAGHGRLILPSELLEKIETFRHPVDKDFECPSCRKYFDSGHIMASHFVKHHYPLFGTGTKELKPFVCKTCHTGFRKASDLIIHASTDHPHCQWLASFKALVEA